MDKFIDNHIVSASYIGKPISNTVMYITKKVENLLINLKSVENCLVFYENTIDIPATLINKHFFIGTSNPQLEYANYVSKLAYKLEQIDRQRKYSIADEGYYIGENVTIGRNCLIEPLSFIGHDVVIGDNAKIFSGAKIKNATIGENFIAFENAAIGTNGFTIAHDVDGSLIRIPTIGKVIIGSNVEIGMQTNVSVGSAGNTIIKDNVKIDALVHIGHDAILGKNIEITAGCVIGGFAVLEDNVFVGINSSVRNRISIGEKSVIGMGSVVTKSVSANITVIGNPARVL